MALCGVAIWALRGYNEEKTGEMLMDINEILQNPIVRRLGSAVILAAAGYLAVRLIMTVVRKALERSKLEKAAHSLITSLIRAGLYLILGLSVASALGIDVTGVVALASVLTLALSLALQNMVANVIGGFIILYTHPFRSGDYVENRLVGMKDRGVYETPGGTILYFAHQQLEMLTVDKDTMHLKQKLAVDYADLIYNGKWYSPLQEALTAFANKANEYVTGTVKLKLYKGNIIPAGTTSPYSLYSENLVTFGESDYDQAQAAGFINLWGLPTKVQALREQGKL